MSQALISVIVPVYNVEKYIEQCVDSLIGQSYSALEIILIDDGSSDGSAAICDSYAQKNEKVRVIHKENRGLSSARNAGLDACTGEYIAFVDSDDWLETDAYRVMMDMMIKYTLDIVCCEGIKTDGKQAIEPCFEHFPTGSIYDGSRITREILLDTIGSQVVQGLYRRKCWDGVRFPEGRLYEDIPTTFKAFAAAETVGFVAEPYYNYRVNPTGISRKPNPLKPYHIFLGFKEHYDYSVVHHPDIAGKCCAKAAHFAISTCFNYYYLGETELDLLIPMEFLSRNKSDIIKNIKVIPFSRRIALRVFYFSPNIFRLLCRTGQRIRLKK